MVTVVEAVVVDDLLLFTLTTDGVDVVVVATAFLCMVRFLSSASSTSPELGFNVTERFSGMLNNSQSQKRESKTIPRFPTVLQAFAKLAEFAS